MTENKISNKLSLLFQKTNHFFHTLRDLYSIWSSPLFDRDFYAKNNPDVKRTGLSPALHFLRYGGIEGRDPGPNFSSLWYLSAYADAKQSGLNPLLHYVRYGRKQGYTTLSIADNLALIRASGMFNEPWYLAINTDVDQSGMDAAGHYLLYGGYEGRDPCPSFHSRWYLDAYEDVKRAGINPLVHYLKFGREQGRNKGCEEGREAGVFTLQRMYDYSKQTGGLLFEDAPERIYLHRPRVIGDYTGDLVEGEAFCPPAYVSVVEDATIFGGSNLVISRQGSVLSDELVDFDSKEIGVKSGLVKFRQKNEVMLEYKNSATKMREGILLSSNYDDNYFHWLVECLPKLILMDELEQYADIPILIPKHLNRNLEEALRRVNTKNRQLISIEPNVAYKVQRLIYPSPLSRILDRYQGKPVFNSDVVLSHKWILRIADLLKGNMCSPRKPWRKLYLARYSKSRNLRNQAIVENILTKQGFQTVELSKMTLQEQVQLFSEAALVVAPSGATLTNMMFCPRGTKVFIFMPNHEGTNYYFWSNLGAINDLDITIIAGKRLFTMTDYYSIHDDFVVDTKLVLDEVNRFAQFS